MATANEIELIARGALFRGSSVLLCRNVRHGYLYLPGGHVEFGETARAAVERELEEECGLRVRAADLVLISEGVFDGPKRRHHELNLVFHVEHDGALPTQIRSREKSIAFEWADVAGVQELDVRPLAVKAWLISGRSTGVEFVSEA